MPWYAIQTKPRKEPALQDGLDRAGIEVYCPRIRRPAGRAGRGRGKEVSLFPGYLFARFDFERDYPRLRWLPGLVRVVMSGGTALPITDATLASVREMERVGVRLLLRRSRWKPGTRVRIVEGPFTGFEGLVTATSRGGDRVRILLELFRRQAALECDPGLLRPLAAAGGR
jgi:transcriptional antiterminator RfaH